MNKGLLAGLVVAVILVGGGIWIFHNASTQNTASENVQTQGNLSVGVADASADIQNVDDIALTVNKVELRDAATQTWNTIAADAKTFRLLDLKNRGAMALYVQKTIGVGHYDAVRVTLGDVTVFTKGNGQIQAVVPASTITMNENVDVNAGQNSSLKLDFAADQSLHLAKGNHYLFAPVVASESRSNADVAVNGDDLVVNGGSMNGSANVGMDLSGAVRPNYVLATNGTLQIQPRTSGSLAGAVTFLMNGKTYLAGSAASAQGTVSGAVTGAMGGAVQGTANVANSLSSGVTLGRQDLAGTPITISGTSGSSVSGSANTNTGTSAGGALQNTVNGTVNGGTSGAAQRSGSLNSNGSVNLGY